MRRGGWGGIIRVLGIFRVLRLLEILGLLRGDGQHIKIGGTRKLGAPSLK